MGAFIYAGAQFGTIISMPLSGLLSEYGFAGGWPSIFYVFGACSTIWCIAYFFLVYEDPSSHPRIDPDERKYIVHTLWGASGVGVSIYLPNNGVLHWYELIYKIRFSIKNYNMVVKTVSLCVLIVT